MGLFNRSKAQPKEEAAKQAPAKAVPKAATKAAAKPALLMKPLVTEKATVTGAYYFKVSKEATKNEISKAFAAKYGKKPRKVNVINVMGKTKLRGRVEGHRGDWKKAVVYLTKGETVDLYQ